MGLFFLFRSLMSLDRSGYPAESMLVEALMKAFHGKYFYFGLKFQSTLEKEGALSLADVTANSTSSVASQSMFDRTEVMEHCHTLVYQMIRSNDGVYATVSDFIRLSIKQLHQETHCTLEAEITKKNSISLSNSAEFRCESGCRTVNNDTSLYKSGSFHSKQKSVAFSFENSSEDSSVFQKQTGNQTEADESGSCDEHEILSKSAVGSSAWLKNETEKKKSNCNKSSPNLVKKDSESYSSPQYSQVGNKFDFDSITPESTCTSQKVDKELLLRAMKQRSIVGKISLLSSVSTKQISLEDGALNIDMSDTSIEQLFAEKNLCNGDNSVPEIEPLKKLLKKTYEHGLSESKYDGQMERARSTLYGLPMSNSSDANEKFMYMPDSEDLSTFMGQFQHDFVMETRPGDHMEANEQQSKGKIANTYLKRSFECKQSAIVNSGKKTESNKICGSKIVDGTIDPFKECESSTIHTLKQEISQSEANVVEMHLPDSEDLENFLASFEETFISQDVDNTCETVENTSDAQTVRENVCNGNCDLINQDKTFVNKISLAHRFQIDLESTGRERKSRSCKYICNSKSKDKLQQSLSACTNKSSTQKAGYGEALTAGRRSTKENKSQTCNVIKHFKSVATGGEEVKTDAEPGCNHDKTGSSCDSGVQLSTSSVDLFASFNSVDDDRIDGNDSKSTSKVSVDGKESQRKENHAMIGKGKEGIKRVFDSFEDSWSELLDDELDENLNSGLRFVQESSEKKDEVPLRDSMDIHVETGSEKSEVILTDKSIVKYIFSDKHVCDEVNQSDLNSSDILFDTPEVHSSKPKTLLASTLLQSLDSFTAQSMDKQKRASCTQDLPQDNGIIKESQSSLQFEKSSSQSPAELQTSELVELKQCRKVMFSKRLRRISSCRLMDIKMREKRSSLTKGTIKRKSCLKSNNCMVKKNIKANDELVSPNKLEPENLNYTDELDSFFIESSQKVSTEISKHLPKQLAKNKCDQLFGKQTPVDHIFNRRNSIYSLSEDRNFSSLSPCTDVLVKHNVYMSRVPDTPISEDRSTSRSCIMSQHQDNRCLATPQTFNNNDSLNELDICQFSVSSDKRKSLSYRSKCQITSSLPGDQRNVCLDTPDIFDEPFNSTQSTNFSTKKLCNSENTKMYKENMCYNNSSLKAGSSRLHNDRTKTVLECLTSNTPTCDNSHLSEHLKTIGQDDYFSPDLFGEAEKFTGCDSGTKSWNVSSVLRKQLFF